MVFRGAIAATNALPDDELVSPSSMGSSSAKRLAVVHGGRQSRLEGPALLAADASDFSRPVWLIPIANVGWACAARVLGVGKWPSASNMYDPLPIERLLPLAASRPTLRAREIPLRVV